MRDTYLRDDVFRGLVRDRGIVPLARRNHVHGGLGQGVRVNAVVDLGGDRLLGRLIYNSSHLRASLFLHLVFASHSLNVLLVLKVSGSSFILNVLCNNSFNVFFVFATGALVVRVFSVTNTSFLIFNPARINFPL